MVAVDASRRAGFADGADGHRVPVVAQRQSGSELVALLRIRSLYVCLLNPAAGAAGENVHRSCIQRGMIRLIPVDPFGRAVFRRRATAMVLPSPLTATVNPNWSSFVALDALR